MTRKVTGDKRHASAAGMTHTIMVSDGTTETVFEAYRTRELAEEEAERMRLTDEDITADGCEEPPLAFRVIPIGDHIIWPTFACGWLG